MKKHKGYKKKSIIKIGHKKARLYIIIFGIFVLLFVCVFLVQNKKHLESVENDVDSLYVHYDKLQALVDNSRLDQQNYPELMWSQSQINSSYDNLAKFIKARLEMCAKYGPSILAPTSDAILSDLFIRNFLSSNVLDRGLLDIKNGQNLLNSNKDNFFKIIVLGDTHVDAIHQSASDDVMQKQRKHIAYINNSSCYLVFAENVSKEVSDANWKSVNNDYYFKKRGTILTDEELRGLLNPDIVWWHYYLMNDRRGNLKILGADYISDLNYLILTLMKEVDSINDKNNKIRNMILNTYQHINFGFREYLIIFECIRKMIKYDQNECILVIGDGHIKTLKEKCNFLGVQMDAPGY